MTAKMTISQWLQRWRRRTNVAGRCFEASREGRALFPELRAVIGATARKPSAGADSFAGILHCWLVAPDGSIIDPTAHQYSIPRAELDYWPYRVQPADPTDPHSFGSRSFHPPSQPAFGFPRTKEADAQREAWRSSVEDWLRQELFWPSREQPSLDAQEAFLSAAPPPAPPPPPPSAVLTAMLAIDKALLEERAPGGHGRRIPQRGTVNQILDRMLTQFIELGAHFELGDLEAIDRACGASATNGSFSALDTRRYAQALAAGNSSAANAWEAAHRCKPWGWSGQHMQAELKDGPEDPDRPWRAVERVPASLNRVGPWSALRIDGVWWRVYSFSPTELRLAAYPGDDGVSGDATTQRKGVKRMTLTRETFAEVAKREGALVKQAAVDRLTLKVPVQGHACTWWGAAKEPRTLEAGLVVPPSVLKQIEKAERRAGAVRLFSDEPPTSKPFLQMSGEERDAWHAACNANWRARVAATEVIVRLTTEPDASGSFVATLGAWRAALPVEGPGGSPCSS